MLVGGHVRLSTCMGVLDSRLFVVWVMIRCSLALIGCMLVRIECVLQHVDQCDYDVYVVPHEHFMLNIATLSM